MSDTKEKILQTSLYLFALDGYEAVSVSNIADELDISKGALYKHFKNKRDIFNSIVDRMNNLEKDESLKINLPAKGDDSLETYRVKTFESIRTYAKAFFNFWTEEPFARDFRRMIMLEQFRNPEMNDLYQSFLVSGPVNQLIDVFRTLQKGNPESLGYKFYSQIYLLISLSDSAEPQLRTEEVLDQHIDDFGERYFFIKRKEVPEEIKAPAQPAVQHKGLLQRASELNV